LQVRRFLRSGLDPVLFDDHPPEVVEPFPLIVDIRPLGVVERSQQQRPGLAVMLAEYLLEDPVNIVGIRRPAGHVFQFVGQLSQRLSRLLSLADRVTGGRRLVLLE